MNKKSFLLILLTSACFLSGCTSVLWAINNPNDSRGHQEVIEVYTDNIQSAFEYKNANLSTQTSSGAVVGVGLPSEGIGFVGKQNIYFVTVGGDVLLSLNTLMKKIPLKSVSNSKYIDVHLVSDYRGYGNAAFNQFLNVRTSQQASSLTTEEKNTLINASFSLRDGYYQRSVDIKGVIIRKERFTGKIPDESSLNDSYRVRFFRNQTISGMDHEKLIFNVLMTPVTLTGDILLLPLYLVMMMENR
ncbi:hypothetical protein [Enterobacter asburiae]|uniref:hypothetical protein n=1 Tax=Enterobacter asburiae TaxID=61645 RepID=UPI001CC17D01|nr:hypothetical protein [Enterobacter asburiae]UAN16699.1 hypothetical protein KGP20_02825 [Enterobacter asburiae]